MNFYNFTSGISLVRCWLETHHLTAIIVTERIVSFFWSRVVHVSCFSTG